MKIHLHRLKILADFLSEISHEIWYTEPQQIVFYDIETHTGFEVHYHRWVFYEIPWISKFQHWSYRGETPIFNESLNRWVYLADVPVHDLADRDKSTVWSAMFFFGLNEEEFLHLFGCGQGLQQPDKFGGMAYPNWDEILGVHVSQNILSFIEKINNNE